MNLLLNDRKLLLILTGGIAAYKAPELVRRLKEQGAQVRVVLTEGAAAFITPLTLQAVSGYPVHQDLLDTQAEAAMGHIELAKWADLILIAPATANAIARLATGQANDLMSTLCLATKAPIAIAPAMNQQMWAAAAVQRNVKQLEADGCFVWGPGVGAQACGDTGAGRMLEPAELLAHIESWFKQQSDSFEQPMQGKKIVITAGPTREALDPVRYISNVSSGKMGYALAQAAAEAGAEVILVSGPVQLANPMPTKIHRVDVESAEQMLAAVQANITKADVFIGCAAVADYRAEQVQPHKIKKSVDEEVLTLKLVKNPDILAWVGSRKAQGEGPETQPVVVGFAAETQELERYARDKLAQKNADMIVANNVSQKDIGFHSDENEVLVFWHKSNPQLSIQQQAFGKQSKISLARALMMLIQTEYLKIEQ